MARTKRIKRASSETLSRLKQRVKRVADKRNRSLIRLLAPEQAGSKTKESGRTIWAGPSQLTGEQIKVVISGYVLPSENTKMGFGEEDLAKHQQYIQIWILNEGDEFQPMHRSICGDCSHRTYKGRSRGFLWDLAGDLLRWDEEVKGACYVQWMKGPNAAWKASNRNEALSLQAASAICSDRLVRLGAAGDPAAVPLKVWKELLGIDGAGNMTAKSITAYSHMWNRPEFQDYKLICMASADSAEEKELARSMGWSTFTVRASLPDDDDRSTLCLNAVPDVHLSCAECRKCDGLLTARKPKDVWVPLHGALANRFHARPSSAFDAVGGCS
jgi:hypothetical protein